jgi:hypothetical protein
LNKIVPVADVFIDTNILKFSAVKKHVYRPKTETINWGGFEHSVQLHEPYTTNDLHKIKNETQRRDAVLLGMLAYAGISGRLNFHIHHEVKHETWGLPGMTSASGQFFGCPINSVPDPDVPRDRTVIGGTRTFKEHALDFLSDIRNPRFVELTKMTGAYQGKDKPLNHNQALDAYHIWCAECANMHYFLTMDYKLQKVVGRSKTKTPVAVRTPDQLLREVLPKFGFLGAMKFLWQGYRFAKPRVGFEEGEGWV